MERTGGQAPDRLFSPLPRREVELALFSSCFLVRGRCGLPDSDGRTPHGFAEENRMGQELGAAKGKESSAITHSIWMRLGNVIDYTHTHMES